MDESQFIELADNVLQKISDKIEEYDEDYTLEVDLLDGILNIELPDGGEYVINRHDSTQEIWLSSPSSGASHFAYEEDEEVWMDSNDNELLEMLQNELEVYINIELY